MGSSRKNLPAPRKTETQVAAPGGRGAPTAIGTPQAARFEVPAAAPHNAKTARTFIYRVVGAKVLILGKLVLHPLVNISRHVMQTQSVGRVSSYRGGATIVFIEVGVAG